MPWVTETVRFERIPLTARKTVKCPGCGKSLKRQRTFEQTINPYNRVNGIPKTRQQILAELADRADAWKQEPETCAQCEESAS